ncbi:hypothetical protein M0804_009471 [Polistes exclamans]|nr:hypothetical protein M0804_009471 [Polistes exclamans]
MVHIKGSRWYESAQIIQRNAVVPSTQASLFSYFGNQLNEAQEKISKLINNGIQTIQQEVEKNVERALAIMNIMKQEGDNIVESIREQIDVAVADMERRINEITNGVDDNIIDECKLVSKGVKEVKVLALSILANCSFCVTDKIDQARDYIENINVASQDAVDSLGKINNEAAECTKNVTNVESTVKAMSCLGSASARATWAVTKEVPTVIINLNKIGFLVGTLAPSLSTCSALTSISLFIDEANNFVSSIDNCIHHKLKDNSTSVPGAGIFS